MPSTITPLPAPEPCCHAAELRLLDHLAAFLTELAETGRITPPAPQPPRLRLVDDAYLAHEAAGVAAILQASQ